MDNEEEMPLVDSEASSLVNTNELLEFRDTMNMVEPESTKQSEITVHSEQTSTSEITQNPKEHTSVDPNQRVNLAHLCLMKVSHLHWIQVQWSRS